MKLTAAALVVLLAALPAAAQEPPSTPPAGTAQTPPTAAPADPQAEPSTFLPVSLDRIRDGLKKMPDQPLLQGLDREADFSVQIQEKQKLEEILKKMDFRSGPVPPGGLYAYEQQRRLFNPVDRPLMQPYAAYSGGEFLTIALENLFANYLGKPLMNAISNANRTRAEREAQDEVNRSIGEYCAAQPDRWSLVLCNPAIR